MFQPKLIACIAILYALLATLVGAQTTPLSGPIASDNDFLVKDPQPQVITTTSTTTTPLFILPNGTVARWPDCPTFRCLTNGDKALTVGEYIDQKSKAVWLWTFIIIDMILSVCIIIPALLYLFFADNGQHRSQDPRVSTHLSGAQSAPRGSGVLANSAVDNINTNRNSLAPQHNLGTSFPAGSAAHTKDESSGRTSIRLPKFNQGPDAGKGLTRFTLSNARHSAGSYSGRSHSPSHSSPREHMSDVFGPALDSTEASHKAIKKL